jgi:enoyl-CoA hydratase/carnithine racemase
MTELVLVETRDGVRTVRFNRPEKKNALTGPMYAAAAAAIGSAADDPAVGAVLILGAPGAFSAGNDVTEFVAAATSGALGEPILAFLRAIAAPPVPLVAAVDGLAVGVGTTMLFHCDLVLASERATFRTPFTDLGLVPEAGSTLLGPRIMGPQLAFELLAGGGAFDAERARQAGFVNRVVPSATIEAEAFAAAHALAAKPRQAMALTRRLLRGDPADVLARIDAEAGHFAERLRSREAQAAFQAFMARKG